MSELAVSAMIQQVEGYLRSLQDSICQGLEVEDGDGLFQQDLWEYAQGGGGRTRVLIEGKQIEKGGVNFSNILGHKLPSAATIARPELTGRNFTATGVSLVIHPRNPFVPTCHLNVRFFVAEKAGHKPIWWFGGGFDLTPYYPFEEDCVHWHQVAFDACQPFGKGYYQSFKQQADRYFYLKHRDETRGIGGLFFDDFNELGFAQSFAFMRSVGDHFLPAYLPIFKRRKVLPFQQLHRDFQGFRRGRYVEFNLVYDRGTLFGLQSGGRTESILMSMPPQANWPYAWQAKSGSPEALLQEKFLSARDWLTLL